MRLRALFVLAVVALVAPAACRDGGTDEPRTTVPTAPTSAATTATTAVSYEVPATIDVPYIEKVMTALDHVDGEATRYAAAQRQIDEKFLSMYVSIYTDKYFQLVKDSWLQIAGEDFVRLVVNPGDPKTTVERVIRADTGCILFQARRDYSSQLREAGEFDGARYVALIPLPAERNSERTNPTPWIMSLDGQNDDGSEPRVEDVCLVR